MKVPELLNEPRTVISAIMNEITKAEGVIEGDPEAIRRVLEKYLMAATFTHMMSWEHGGRTFCGMDSSGHETGVGEYPTCPGCRKGMVDSYRETAARALRRAKAIEEGATGYIVGEA
jgi:hypothetical protein